MESETFAAPVVNGIICLLLTTLIARAIRYTKCLQRSPLGLFSVLPALRPVIEAAVEATKRATEWMAVAVGAASAKSSAGNRADAAFSAPRSLPRTVKRRHEREREKREKALRRSNTNSSIAFSRRNAIEDGVSNVLSATPNALPQKQKTQIQPQLNDDEQSYTYTKPNRGLKQATVTIVNFFLYSDNNTAAAWSKSIDNEHYPSKPAAPLDSPREATQKPPADKPTTAATPLLIEAHNEDKGLARPPEVAVWHAGFLSFGGVTDGSPSAGEQQWLPSGAGKGGSSRRSNNKKGTDKRKRDHHDGRDGDKKRGGHGPCHRNDDDDEWDGRFLACPYYKMDPHRYSRCWAKYELKRFADVKQHLIRCHKVKEYYCSRCCLVEFEDHADWQAHSQQCNEPNPASGPENFTMDEIHRLSNAPRGATNEEKYYWVWDNFFFNHPRPESPYVQDYLSETRAVHGPDLEDALHAVLGNIEPLREGEGEGPDTWRSRIAGLSPRILEHMSQAEHPRRLRQPPRVVVAHGDAHDQANQQAVGPPQQIQRPHPLHQPQPVAVSHALRQPPPSNDMFPPVANALQGPPSLSLPPHPHPLSHRPQRVPGARPVTGAISASARAFAASASARAAAASASARIAASASARVAPSPSTRVATSPSTRVAASPSTRVATSASVAATTPAIASPFIHGGAMAVPPGVMGMNMMNMMNSNYQNSFSRAPYRQRSHYPPIPHPPAPQRPSTLQQAEDETPIDPNLFLEYTPPPGQPRPQPAPPPPHDQPANILDQPANFLQDEDDFDLFIQMMKDEPYP